jgi:hypothetical protein
MTTLADRIIRALKLDVSLYQEVKADPASLVPAMQVVVFSSLSAGIGSLRLGMTGFFVGTLAAFAGWFIWALVIYIAGVRILPEPQTRTSIGELFRVTGFASAPGIIRLLAVIPHVGGMVIFAASIWTLMAMIVATRQALDYKSGWRTAGVCLLGWVIQGMAIAPFLLMMTVNEGQ